jgi:hypothetical protein
MTTRFYKQSYELVRIDILFVSSLTSLVWTSPIKQTLRSCKTSSQTSFRDYPTLGLESIHNSYCSLSSVPSSTSFEIDFGSELLLGTLRPKPHIKRRFSGQH